MLALNSINDAISQFVWGPAMLILLVGTGIWFSFRTGFFQLRYFGHILKNTLGKVFCRKKSSAGEGSITPFQALTTALAATVGTGNVVGVATAIASGGPGAVFWMWSSAFFGMMTKFSEVVLAVKFREKNAKGEWVGGPMYYIKNGLGKRFSFLAVLFAAFGALASLGIGNLAQVNSITEAVAGSFKTFGLISGTTVGTSLAVRIFIGVFIMLSVGLVLIGGLKRIGKVTEKLVPFMGLFYAVGSVVVLIGNADKLGAAFSSIFACAFNLKAATGGMMGFSLMQAARYGVARGVFSNEAGLGSTPMAHGSADTDSPVKQGLYGILEVFLDTLVVCTLTALVILSSGVFTGMNNVGASPLQGASMAIAAFETVLGNFGSLFIAVCILLFAFSTLLGWSLYGQRCTEFLLGPKSKRLYHMIFLIFILLGATMDMKLAWSISDTLNGLMALPNLIALLSLSGVVFKLTKAYKRTLKSRR